MNSQFKNSKIGTLLYIFIISIVVIVTILIFWFMLFGYKMGTYSEDTILGSVYLGGLEEDEVNAKITEKYVDWLDDETIVYEITYQGYSYEFDRELFSFNIGLSMEFLVDGQTNVLYVQYQESGTDRQDTIDEISNQLFLQGIIDNIDVEAMINDILADAGKMKTYSLKRVEDYIVDPELSIVTISEERIEMTDGISGQGIVDGLIEAYGTNVITVGPKELFDVFDELNLYLSDEQMTMMSRPILKQLLATNFSIHEVHYDPIIDFSLYPNLEDYPFKGSNTVINETANSSFSFYNPNDSEYTFTVTYNEMLDEIIVKMEGLEFVNTIVATEHIEIIPKATKPSYIEDPVPGHDGMIVVIHRLITDIEGNVIYDKDIIFEYYSPEIEIVAGS